MKRIIFILFSSFIFSACSNIVDDEHFSTFTEELITSYLKSHPDIYSEFCALLEETGMSDLLNAYGTYTCFAPTNEAVRNYYAKKGTSFAQLTKEEIREIVYNHLITQAIRSVDFPSGVVPKANMDGRYLYLSYETENNATVIYVNENARIIQLDQKVHNGVIHTVDAILEPSKVQLPNVLSTDEQFSLFYQALRATGLADSLLLYKDENYVEDYYCCYNTNGAHDQTILSPPQHDYGYTILAESDSIYKLFGIHNLDDLKAKAAEIYNRIYPEDRNITDITNRSNSLNRFISYHLLDRMQAENEFISEKMEYFFLPGTTVYEYIETLCPNTLMEVQTGTLFNKKKDGSAIRIISPNHRAQNGVYHGIDNLLVYDEGVINDVLNKRLRMNETSLFSEFTTNKLRMWTNLNAYSQEWMAIPPGYLKNATYSEGTRLELTSCNCMLNYMGDDMQFQRKWDFTLRLPPVPPGTYEVRLGYIPWTERGVSQIYFDGEPCGIPLDMRLGANHPKIGWIADRDTDDNGVENDKTMRNRGYMKGSDVHWGWNHTQIARESSGYIRKIITTKTFQKAEPHYLRVKCVLDDSNTNVFHIDYIEYVPTTYLIREGRD